MNPFTVAQAMVTIVLKISQCNFFIHYIDFKISKYVYPYIENNIL